MKKNLQSEGGNLSNRPSSLDLSSEALEELSSRAVKLVSDYFARVSEMPVFPATTGGETAARLGSIIPLNPDPLDKLIEDCRTIIEGSRHNGHPRFFGYVASPATAPGAFADLIASTLNPNTTSWRSAPAATEVERMVVRWLGSLISYGENAHGLLVSGGSMANLLAILIALRARADRNTAYEGLWRSETPMVMYASDQVHMSIQKAADVLGIGRNQVRIIETDNTFRMKVSTLRQRIQRDVTNGLKPFCVVASAGTVNTGAVDPLADIAAVAKEFGLWYHVDGAYGAPGILDAVKRPLFAGLDRADSVSLDPHKWLYAPVDCGCLLFSDAAAARAPFTSNVADYIKVHEQADEESFAFWDYGIELSRRFRALKVWFTLKYFGTRRLAAAISDDIALARYLAESIQASEDFELLAPVELSICCFRYVPTSLQHALVAASDEEKEKLNALLDELNTGIMLSVQRGGKAYLSNATIHGKFALRICITNFRTTRSDLDLTLEAIRDAAKGIERERGGKG